MHEPGDPPGPPAVLPPAQPQGPQQPLVLRGTVTAIAPLATQRQHARWRVVLDVDEVLSGRFSSPRFEFAVHSPARSGLANGQVLTLTARPDADGGYRVDEHQWSSPKP